jgi:hypothetical protein
VARVAIASAVIGLVATAFLVGFFALEAPRVFAGEKIATPLGTINDVLLALQFGLLVVVVAELHSQTGWVRTWQDFYSNYLLLGSGVLAGLTLVVGIPAWTVLFGLRSA